MRSLETDLDQVLLEQKSFWHQRLFNAYFSHPPNSLTTKILFRPHFLQIWSPSRLCLNRGPRTQLPLVDEKLVWLTPLLLRWKQTHNSWLEVSDRHHETWSGSCDSLNHLACHQSSQKILKKHLIQTKSDKLGDIYWRRRLQMHWATWSWPEWGAEGGRENCSWQCQGGQRERKSMFKRSPFPHCFRTIFLDASYLKQWR